MSKKELAEKLGFDFEEVKDILSEETLKSFEQNVILGGEGVLTTCEPPQPNCGGLPQDAICIKPVLPGGCEPIQTAC